MADLSFAPVAGRVPQQPTMSLADMVNMARGVQAYKQTQLLNPIQLQQAQTELLRLQSLMPEEIKRAQAESKVAEATVTPRITSAQEAARTATAGAGSAELRLAGERQLAIANRLTSLINSAPIVAAEQNPQTANPDALADLMKAYGEQQGKELGVPPEQIATLTQPYIDMARRSPAGLRSFLKERLLTGMDNAVRATTMQPGVGAIPVSTGAGGATVAQNIFGPQQAGTALPGTTFVSQLPPTTQRVITKAEAEAMGRPEMEGATVFVGPQGAPQGAPAPQMPPVSALGPLQSAPLVQTPAMAGDHWKGVQQAASTAQADIGVLQNIKKYAKDAFAGVGGGRKELAAGILNAIGIPAYQSEKIDTELLAKNANLLALVGGNTDAARALAQGANPNTKMNPEAIRIAADQLLGIKRMALAQQRFLGQFQTDPRRYMENKQLFDQVADPRLFQEMSPDDVRKLKKSMSPAEIQDMTRKIEQARRLGVL